MGSVSGRIAVASILYLSLAVGVPAGARAAVPEPPAPGAVKAAPDSSHFLPRWLHLHGSAGYGWIGAPSTIRARYEAGQDFEFGLEARMQKSLRLRFNGEYQVLPALGKATYAFVAFKDVDGNASRDTLSFDWRQRGWLAASRVEGQWRALPHGWLLAGVGRGYLSAGVRTFHIADPNASLDVQFPGSSGWAWITSLGARYDFEIFGPVLGAEVRWSSLDRPQDRLQTWSVRIGWQGR
jgi:hypothetical protein